MQLNRAVDELRSNSEKKQYSPPNSRRESLQKILISEKFCVAAKRIASCLSGNAVFGILNEVIHFRKRICNLALVVSCALYCSLVRQHRSREDGAYSLPSYFLPIQIQPLIA